MCFFFFSQKGCRSQTLIILPLRGTQPAKVSGHLLLCLALDNRSFLAIIRLDISLNEPRPPTTHPLQMVHFSLHITYNLPLYPGTYSLLSRILQMLWKYSSVDSHRHTRPVCRVAVGPTVTSALASPLSHVRIMCHCLLHVNQSQSYSIAVTLATYSIRSTCTFRRLRSK